MSLPANQNSFMVWHKQFINTDGDLEYREMPAPSEPSMLAEPFLPPCDASIIRFSSEGSLLATVGQTRLSIIWIWTLGSALGLFAALYHEHPIKQIVWHPSETALIIKTANNVPVTVDY